MELWDYPGLDDAAARATAAACPAGSEVYRRDDASGLIVLSSGGVAPPGAAAVRELQLLFAGGRYGKDAGDWLFAVGLWTPGEWRDEFLAWYRVEHLPMLLECPIWDGCRFVEQRVTDGCQFFALHQFADRAALDSDHRMRSRATHWFARLARNDWFDRGFTRTLCRRLGSS